MPKLGSTRVSTSYDPTEAVRRVQFTANRSLRGPKSVPAGYQRVALENATPHLVTHGLLRVRDGADPKAARQVLLESTLGLLTPRQLETRRRQLIAGFYGGAVCIPPGQSGEVLLTLKPGRYLVYTHAAGVSQTARPVQVTTLHVTPHQDLHGQPTPDYTVVMVDHAFAFPDKLRAGRHLWHVANLGQHDHFMVIAKLLPGKTPRDVQAFLRGNAPTPVETATWGVHTLSPGLSNDLWLELAPGDYLALCHLTDPATGVPQALLGMTQIFRVEALPEAEHAPVVASLRPAQPRRTGQTSRAKWTDLVCNPA